MRIGLVRMKKFDLIRILEDNKKKHDAIYNAAVEGYWAEAEEKLNEKLAKIREKKQVDPYLGIAFPENHAEDYEEILQSLELSVHNEIELNQNQFNCYVRNKWNWREQFVASNSYYADKVGRSATVQGF